MNTLDTYLIRIVGKVDQVELNAKSPCVMTVETTESSSTTFSVCADQAGLIGLMRYLHGLGFQFLSINLIDT